ncbi:MAG TPA: M48 family metalloprotease [Planctomycetota bacterium]|nr:M48 family metalloprotease [Planctomycetota bacterium]
MDFFAHQDDARRSTRRLVALFALAVLAIIAALNLVAVLAMDLAQDRHPLSPDQRWQAHLVVSVASAALIALGSLSKMWELRAGGAAVASRLGGRPVEPGTADPAERQLLNVVEEMAIASGTPVPAVFVLDHETGINAFAAGLGADDAAVAVTRGTLLQLDRNELSGVIGHEFSHLLNGDSRLNLRLIGVLHGILLIGLTGRVLLRAVTMPHRGRRDRRGGGGGVVLVLIVGGIALIVIGAIGTFFGRLIQSAVSRSREFLADASAVQFTRDPGAVAGALKRIGGSLTGSLVRASRAPEASHLFFADAVARQWTSLLSTHPPLAERIRRVLPGWDGRFPPPLNTPIVHDPQRRPSPDEAAHEAADEVTHAATANAMAGRSMGPDPHATAPTSPVDVAPPAASRRSMGPATAVSALAGTVPETAVHDAQALIGRLPPEALAAAHDPYSARAVVHALLLDGLPAARARQIALLHARDPAVAALTSHLHAGIAAAGAAARLPLVDLCVPSLRRLSAQQHRAFVDDVRALISADDRTTLDEWLLARLVIQRLVPRPHGALGRVHALRPLMPAAAVALSALARAGHPDDETAAQAAFTAASALFSELPLGPLRPAKHCEPAGLDEALDRLGDTAPKVKRRLVDACAAAVATDGARSPRENELLRVICGCVGVPVPLAG